MLLTRLRDNFVGRVGRILLAAIGLLIAGGFIFWNVDFRNVGSASYAAKVNGRSISLEEFQRDLQQQEAQYQQLYKIDLNEAMRSQLRRSVLDRLVQQEALAQRVQSQGYHVSDQRLATAVRSINAFQVDGAFNMDEYRRFLANQGMSDSGFLQLERQQLALVDLQQGISDSSFLTPNEFVRYVALTNQKRRFGYALFEADDFKDKAEVTDDDVAAYYKEHHDEFMTEEAAALEYVEVTRAEVAASIKVTDADLQQYYDEHKDAFSAPEERHADHILITPKKGETDEQTKARAEAVLKRVQGGEDFAQVAKQVSEDPGTAKQGGDLGWIGRGMLTGPFEDALFGMKVGEVTGPVKTDFGYHIIRLEEIRGGEVQPFDKVKDKLLKQVRTDRADDAFYDLSNKLADSAFDAYDNLETVATQLRLPLKKIARFPRSGDPAVFKNSTPVVDAVFGAEPLEKGVNSGLIKLSDDDVVVARVTDRFPSEQKPLEAVSGEIQSTILHQKAQALAAKAAEGFVAGLPKDLSPGFLGPSEVAGTGVPADAGEKPAADAADKASADKPAADPKGAAGKKTADKAAKTDKKGAGKAADSGAADSEAAALAAKQGGSWVAPKWVERSDSSVPTEVLAQAFNMPPPAGDAVETRSLGLAAGDHAVILLDGMALGKPEAMTSAELNSARQELDQRVGSAEIESYAATVRDQAKVRVPEDVLQPSQ